MVRISHTDFCCQTAQKKFSANHTRACNNSLKTAIRISIIFLYAFSKLIDNKTPFESRIKKCVEQIAATLQRLLFGNLQLIAAD